MTDQIPCPKCGETLGEVKRNAKSAPSSPYTLFVCANSNGCDYTARPHEIVLEVVQGVAKMASDGLNKNLAEIERIDTVIVMMQKEMMDGLQIQKKKKETPRPRLSTEDWLGDALKTMDELFCGCRKYVLKNNKPVFALCDNHHGFVVN